MAGGVYGELARRALSRVMQEREDSARRRSSDSAYDGWKGYVTPRVIPLLI